MSLSNIADVTNTITTIIDTALQQAGVSTNLTPIEVFPDLPARPPRRRGVGFYMYHLMENANHKNLPSPGLDNPPVRYVSMGLNLYYQLSANSDKDDGKASLEEQLWMSIAVKALHDNPRITLPGERNIFYIALQPISYNEALQFWNAGQEAVKLSAFYEVSVVLLDPEIPKSYAGRVLTYGTYIFPGGGIKITTTQSTVQFQLPVEVILRTVKIQPAQVTQGNTFDIEGFNFNSGDVELRIYNTEWPAPAQLAATDILAKSEGKITARIPQLLNLLITPAQQKDMLPGMYALQVIIIKKFTQPDGSIKELKNTSNKYPIIVSPDVTNPATNAVAHPNANAIVVIQGGPFSPATEVELYIGEQKFERNNPPGPGEFDIHISGVKITAKLPATLPSGFLPIRILVNGAESPPRWVQVP